MRQHVWQEQAVRGTKMMMVLSVRLRHARPGQPDRKEHSNVGANGSTFSAPAGWTAA